MADQRNDQENLTELLERAAEGDANATDQIMPLVYDQLRSIAQSRMADERKDHTLQATALVHEAYARLMGQGQDGWHNRRHFYFSATRAMRQILIEHARAQGRLKRGGAGIKKLSLDYGAIADLARTDNSAEIIALDEALRRLEKERPRVSQVVQLRFFGGLSVEETGMMLDVSTRTVNLDWSLARAWLFSVLSDETQKEDGNE